jgi:uncharacterized protein HemX
MSPLEDSLRNALREPQPREDFAARVLAGMQARTQGKRRVSSLRLRAAAALILAAFLGAAGFHYHQRREEGLERDRARDQVLEAFRLAEHQLKPFRQRLETMRMTAIPISKGERQQ